METPAKMEIIDFKCDSRLKIKFDEVSLLELLPKFKKIYQFKTGNN